MGAEQACEPTHNAVALVMFDGLLREMLMKTNTHTHTVTIAAQNVENAHTLVDKVDTTLPCF